jgi:hypothetical protein
MNQISNSEIIIEKMNEEDNCEEIYTTRLRSVVRNINNKINYSAKNLIFTYSAHLIFTYSIHL